MSGTSSGRWIEALAAAYVIVACGAFASPLLVIAAYLAGVH